MDRISAHAYADSTADLHGEAEVEDVGPGEFELTVPLQGRKDNQTVDAWFLQFRLEQQQRKATIEYLDDKRPGNESCLTRPLPPASPPLREWQQLPH